LGQWDSLAHGHRIAVTAAHYYRPVRWRGSQLVSLTDEVGQDGKTCLYGYGQYYHPDRKETPWDL